MRIVIGFAAAVGLLVCVSPVRAVVKSAADQLPPAQIVTVSNKVDSGFVAKKGKKGKPPKKPAAPADEPGADAKAPATDPKTAELQKKIDELRKQLEELQKQLPKKD